MKENRNHIVYLLNIQTGISMHSYTYQIIHQLKNVRVPVICEKEISSNIKEMDRSKILVPRELTIAQFMKVIRKRIKLREEEAIFLYVNEKIMGTGKLISEVYASEKDEDGFLYVSYSSENVFG